MTTARGTTSSPVAVSFVDRFAAARAAYGPLCFGLDPSGPLLDEWGVGDTVEGLERFVDIVLEGAVGSVGVVKPQSAFYERHGWQGIRALSRLASAGRAAGLLVLLDAKRGDLGSTNDAYARAYFGDGAGLTVDALTVTGYLGLPALRAFFDRAAGAHGAVFVVTRSSNPEGRLVQQARHYDGSTIEQTFIAQIAQENARLADDDDGLGPVGAVFGAGYGVPEFDIRAMRGLFLVPGLGEQGTTPEQIGACFASCPERVLPSASRSLLKAGPTVRGLKDALGQLNDALGRALGP